MVLQNPKKSTTPGSETATGLELEPTHQPADKCPLRNMRYLPKYGRDYTASLWTKLNRPLTSRDRGGPVRIVPEDASQACSSVQASWLELATGPSHEPREGRNSSKCKNVPLMDTINVIDWHLNLQPSRLSSMEEHPFARLAAQAWPAN